MSKFYQKQKVYKVHNQTNVVEKQWKNSKLNKIYIVKHSDESVFLYNVEDVAFSPHGKVTVCPPEIKSNWVNHHIEPAEEN